MPLPHGTGTVIKSDEHCFVVEWDADKQWSTFSWRDNQWLSKQTGASS